MIVKRSYETRIFQLNFIKNIISICQCFMHYYCFNASIFRYHFIFVIIIFLETEAESDISHLKVYSTLD